MPQQKAYDELEANEFRILELQPGRPSYSAYWESLAFKREGTISSL
jgi:hypothetical protein